MRYLSLVFLLPYITDLTPLDSSYTDYSFGVGRGEYTSLDCGGNPSSTRFFDAGVFATHKFEAPFRAGVAATIIRTHEDRFGIVPWPDLALDFPYFSVGTTGLRVGHLEEIYADFGMGDKAPMFSGPGFFRFGIGGMMSGSNTRYWVGISSFPYRKSGLALYLDFPVAENNFLFFSGRYGDANRLPESGISLGLRFRTGLVKKE